MDILAAVLVMAALACFECWCSFARGANPLPVAEFRAACMAGEDQFEPFSMAAVVCLWSSLAALVLSAVCACAGMPFLLFGGTADVATARGKRAGAEAGGHPRAGSVSAGVVHGLRSARRGGASASPTRLVPLLPSDPGLTSGYHLPLRADSGI